jgi:hypothetical protein
MQGGSEVTLSAHATLTSTTTKQVWARPPIDVDFQVLMFTASGLIVRFLKVFEKSSYQSVKWVRYLTKASGSYQVRVSEFVLPLEVGLVLINTFGYSSEVDIHVYFHYTSISYFVRHRLGAHCLRNASFSILWLFVDWDGIRTPSWNPTWLSPILSFHERFVVLGCSNAGSSRHKPSSYSYTIIYDSEVYEVVII